MFGLFLDAFRWLITFSRIRNSPGPDSIALRQQLCLLKHKHS